LTFELAKERPEEIKSEEITALNSGVLSAGCKTEDKVMRAIDFS
jgi:hypothetical protein